MPRRSGPRTAEEHLAEVAAHHDDLAQMLERAREERDALIVAYNAEGMSLRRIAEAVGVNHSRVGQIVEKWEGSPPRVLGMQPVSSPRGSAKEAPKSGFTSAAPRKVERPSRASGWTRGG